MDSRHPGYPSRVFAALEAEKRFPDLYSPLVGALDRMDPLADEAIAALAHLPASERQMLVERATRGGPVPVGALRVLVEHAADVTRNSDHRNAGAIVRRSGVLGGLVLGLRCLVYGYASPAGNKPLALSGALVARAERRLAETARFVVAVAEPGSLIPFREGFRISLAVRLMHAQVRRLCLEHPSWNSQRYGRPINQHDMLATILLFSCVFVDGVRALGVDVSEVEADAFQRLYFDVGRLLGVEEQLLPTTFDEAMRRAEFIRWTQAPPDDDSSALVRALLQGPSRTARSPRERRVAEAHELLVSGLCRYLIGNELADELHVPRGTTRAPWALVRALVSGLEWWRKIAGLDAKVEAAGARYFSFVVAQGLQGAAARFLLPEALEGRVAASVTAS